jgi:hypothetical protein
MIRSFIHSFIYSFHGTKTVSGKQASLEERHEMSSNEVGLTPVVDNHYDDNDND